jgi:hypothetical protein
MRPVRPRPGALQKAGARDLFLTRRRAGSLWEQNGVYGYGDGYGEEQKQP